MCVDSRQLPAAPPCLRLQQSHKQDNTPQSPTSTCKQGQTTPTAPTVIDYNMDESCDYCNYTHSKTASMSSSLTISSKRGQHCAKGLRRRPIRTSEISMAGESESVALAPPLLSPPSCLWARPVTLNCCRGAAQTRLWVNWTASAWMWTSLIKVKDKSLLSVFIVKYHRKRTM